MIFLCIMNYGDAADMERVRPRHRAYLGRMIEDGRVICAGFLLPAADRGVFIYQADGLEAARQLAEDDPFVSEKVIRGYELSEYEIHGANGSLLRPTG